MFFQKLMKNISQCHNNKKKYFDLKFINKYNY